jgi:hypothetical protein
MKRLLPFLLVFAAFPFSAAYSQSHKIFINATFDKDNTFGDLRGLHGPQAGYGWQNKASHWHEIELSSLNSSKTFIVNSGTLKKTSFGLRYQYTIPLFQSKFQHALKPEIGIGVSNFNGFNSMHPDVSVFYPTAFKDIALKGYIAPGVKYVSPKHFFASLSLPIDFMESEYMWNRVLNPMWTAGEQRNSSISFDAFMTPSLVIRAGGGITF